MKKNLFRGIFLAVSCCTLFSVSASADSQKDYHTGWSTVTGASG